MDCKPQAALPLPMLNTMRDCTGIFNCLQVTLLLFTQVPLSSSWITTASAVPCTGSGSRIRCLQVGNKEAVDYDKFPLALNVLGTTGKLSPFKAAVFSVLNV